MSLIQYAMKVSVIRDHTPSVRELVLTAVTPDRFRFRAGQFVMLHVPQDTGKPALRAYSIASDEHDETGFRLLFKAVENGVATRFVWALKGDETLTFTGPFGKVFFQEPPTEQIVFLNTGTGLSQHLSYLLSKRAQYPDLSYRLLFGVRTQKDIYYRDVLENLRRELKDFQYDYVLSRPEADWTGKTGYVQDHLRGFDLSRPTTVYLCGNGGMIKAVKADLSDRGFDPGRIWSEAFD